MTSSSCLTAAVTSICCSSSHSDMPHGLRPHKFLAKDPMSRFLTIYFDQVKDEFLQMAKLDPTVSPYSKRLAFGMVGPQVPTVQGPICKNSG